MRKLFTFLFLLFCSSLALADTPAIHSAFSSASSTNSPLNPAALTNYTDMSIYYLSQIFGTVGTVLAGTSSQLMGRLFEQLNWGIFIISGVMVGYAVMLSTIRLATEGVTIAPGKSTLFTLIKLAIGVACIIPMSGTGYSLLQEMVMNVVVKGVGLADSIWTSGLEYLNDGGVVWTMPTQNDNNNPYTKIITPNAENALLSTSLGAQVFQNEVCMIGSRDTVNYQGPVNNGNPISVNGQSQPFYDVWQDTTHHTFNFPGINDPNSSGSSCGTASWNINGACSAGDTACAIGQEAMARLISSLMPAAQQYYCFESPNAPSCRGGSSFKNVNDGLSPYMFNALVSYYPTIQIYAKMQIDKSQASNKNFIQAAEQEGWIMAGRYYWDIMQITAVNDSLQDPSSYVSTSVTPPTGLGGVPALNKVVQKAPGDFTTAAGSSEFQNYINSVYTQSAQSSLGAGHAEQMMDANGNISAANTISDNAPLSAKAWNQVHGIFSPVINEINKISSLFSDFANSSHYNPIVFMHQVGAECIQITIIIWLTGGAVGFAAMLLMGACSSINPIPFALQTLLEWIKPIFMAIAMLLWAGGFFLTVYVPLYPYLIFLFASVGWFISVAEALVAAPLVALGLAHPENHDLLGKAEQAVMLLLSVFIQPSLLVIGMLAGIVFSYVAFELLIYTYSGFMMDILGTPQNTASMVNILDPVTHSQIYTSVFGGHGISTVITLPLLIVVFCVITYTILTQTFSLIHLLRDNVMRWIGAPSTGLPSPEQLAQETRGAVSTYSKGTGDGLGGSIVNPQALKATGELMDAASGKKAAEEAAQVAKLVI